MIKKYFVTGLALLLPITLTIVIVSFIFNLLTVPFLGFVKAIFSRYQLFAHGFLFLNADQFQTVVAKILIFICLFLFTLLLGFITRWFFFHSFLRFADYIVHRIPFVSTIYKTCQDVIRTIFTSQAQSFKQVVMVRFPSPNSFSIGLVTRESVKGLNGTSYQDSVAVFVPTTPNPTSGFLVLYKKQDLIYLDMKVEEAFKYIISCGVIAPEFQAMPQESKDGPSMEKEESK